LAGAFFHAASDKLAASANEAAGHANLSSSVYSIPDLDALDAIMTMARPGFPSMRAMPIQCEASCARMLAQVESAAWGVVRRLGMARRSSAIVSHRPTRATHPCAAIDSMAGTVHALHAGTRRFGVAADYVDCNDSLP